MHDKPEWDTNLRTRYQGVSMYANLVMVDWAPGKRGGWEFEVIPFDKSIGIRVSCMDKDEGAKAIAFIVNSRKK